MRKIVFFIFLFNFLFALSQPVIDLRMDECNWDNDPNTYELENNGTLGDDYNGTAFDDANVTIGKINSGGNIDATSDDEENKSILLKTDYSLPSEYTLNTWIKFPLDTDGHEDFEVRECTDYFFGICISYKTIKVNYFNIADRKGSDSDFIYFTYDKTDDSWSLVVSDDDGGDSIDFNPQNLSGWHMLTFVVSDGGTDFYLDGDKNATFDTHPNTGELGLLFNSDYLSDSDDEPNGQSIGADVDEFEIYDENISDDIKTVYDNENDGKNYDGSERSIHLCPITPECKSTVSGLWLSTYDISGYDEHYPEDHDDYDDLENNYATVDNEYGRGVINEINTSTDSNNNPFQDDPDNEYLSIIEGYIYIPKAGEYSFAINGDDAVEVILNDEFYYGWYGEHTKDGTDHNTTIYFEEPGYYKIKFRHEDWEGDDNYYLYWKKPGDDEFEIVPSDYFVHCPPPNQIIDLRMDECKWDDDNSTYEIKNYGTLGDDYNGTAFDDANVTDGKIFRGGNIDATSDDEENKSILLKTDYSLPSEYTLNVWIKFPLDTDGHKDFTEGWGRNSKTVNYFNIADRNGSDSDFIYFKYDKTYDSWSLNVKDDDGIDSIDFNPQNLSGWHMLTFVVSDDGTDFYFDGDKNATFDTHPNTGELGLLFNSDYLSDSDDEPNGQSIGADVDEFEIYDGKLKDDTIKSIYNSENDGKNYDGSDRIFYMCPITPSCSDIEKGDLILSTYNISGYNEHYPENHDDYNDLENNYAVSDKEYGQGLIEEINTPTDSNNNPFHNDPDDEYLSIIEGYIYIPKAGEYSFAINGDDAVEVILNDEFYYGWYGEHTKDGTDHNTEIYFGEPGYYKIKFRHEDWDGDDNYYLYWKKPGDSDFEIVPSDYFWFCPSHSSIFNAVDYIASGCNANDDWNNPITTKIVNKDFNLTILSKDDYNATEANITKVDFYEFNTSDCSGDYTVENICDDNTSNKCNDTNSSGCALLGSIKIDKAVKCIIVHIEGKKADDNSSDTNESNSTDDFSIRPYEFKIINIPSVIKSGEDFNITLEALDYNGNPAKDYNESVYIDENESADLEYNISKSGCYNGNLAIQSGGGFKDGEANVTLNYDEVGEVNLTLKEINGSEFAKVDENDTPDSNRFIEDYKTQIFVIPHHFKIDANLSNYDDNNFTYLDNNLSLYSVLDINITAENENNETTKNYNEACYAKDIEINISKNLSPFPENLNNIIYFYKDAENNKSDIVSQDINDTIEINYTDTNFTTDDNGSTHLTLFINFDRNDSNATEPFEMNISEINVSDEDGAYGTNTSVEGNATYYYGSVTLFDEVANEDEFDTRDDYFIIYDNNSTDNKLPSDNEILPDWYLNSYHQSIDGNISDDNIVVSSDYNASNQISGVEVSVNPINNGKFSFHIKRTYSSVKFAVIHLLEPNLKWLWYSKFGNEYNDSNDSTCLNHFCFAITWKDNSSEEGVIKSGEVNGTETNVTDDNVTKRGVKIFR